MKTLEAKSWREFLEVIDVFHQPGFVFRGVCSERHELVPKVGRKETLTRYSLDQEQLLLDIFKQRARAHINPLPQGDLEWLSLAQHHGLPTRLLDWTLSPIIALYFAVREDITNDAAVYACHLPRDDPKFDPFKIHRVYKYYPPHISPRIPAQQALFTVIQVRPPLLRRSSIRKMQVEK